MSHIINLNLQLYSFTFMRNFSLSPIVRLEIIISFTFYKRLVSNFFRIMKDSLNLDNELSYLLNINDI